MTNASDRPPPVLDCARVLAYAIVDASVHYTERQTFYVDGKLLGPVPRLAICQNIGEEDVMVFHCDDGWNVLGAAGGHDSAAKAKREVERAYSGIKAKWIDTHVSVDEANAYLREHSGDHLCSFCGRMFHEVSQLFEGANGRICDICVREFATLVAKGED